MIKLTKVDGTEFFINEGLIERIQTFPNTIITMNSQTQYIVKESYDEIYEYIIAEKRKIFSGI